MATLHRAHQELFVVPQMNVFLRSTRCTKKCADDHIASDDLWSRPQDVEISHDLRLCIDGSSAFNLTDWSFSQLCRMAGVSRDTINRLSAKTASQAFEETLPHSDKPLQLLTTGEHIRSIHGASYTRLWNVELLDMVKEYASDFQPPQVAMDGNSTGLYCGEQDMFAFLIDPTGWTEIEGEDLCLVSSSGTQKLDVARWAFKLSGFSESARITLSGTQLTLLSLRASIPLMFAMASTTFAASSRI